MSKDPNTVLRVDYLLHLADDSLIQGHRNSEWTGFGPALEQDIALSNIALDLVGQARNFYQYAAELINEYQISILSLAGGESLAPITEDSLAYLRDGWDFKNCLLSEQPNGDWAKTILKQFFFSAYQFYLFEELQQSLDKTIAAVSAKAIKEVTYHLRWSSEWVIRLGDGTAESRQRMLKALDDLWPFTQEPFLPAAYENQAMVPGIAADLSLLKPKWDQKIAEIFKEAFLPVPQGIWMQSGGKEGRHSEHLGFILAEMQFLQRAYPLSSW
jgi:ring-1,2-phenylacetyl-CoA epoxidase subunit PaaC